MDKFSYSLPGEVVVRDGQVTDEWKEEDHPRVPPGSPGGGQFTSGGGGEQTYPQHTKEGKGAWKGSPVPKDVWPFSASKSKGHHVSRFMEMKEKPAQDTPRYRAILNYLAHEAKYYGLGDEVSALRQKAAQSYLLQSQKLASTDPQKSQQLHAKWMELTAKPGGKKEAELVSTQTGKVISPPPELHPWDKLSEGEKIEAETYYKKLEKKGVDQPWEALSNQEKLNFASVHVDPKPSPPQGLAEKWAALSPKDKQAAGNTWQAAKQMELEQAQVGSFKDIWKKEPSEANMKTIVLSTMSEAESQWNAFSDHTKYQAAVKYGVVQDNPNVLLEVSEPPKKGDHPWDYLIEKNKDKAFLAFSHANLDPPNAAVLWSGMPESEKMAWYYKAVSPKAQTTVNLETQEVKVEPAPPPPPPKAKPPTPSPGDLAKAKSPVPYPLYGKPEVDAYIKPFNDKYANKTLTDPDELAQKVADFKVMYANMSEAKAKISKELGHVLAQKSKATLEDKLQAAMEKYGAKEEKRLKALFNLAGATSEYYLEASKPTKELSQVEVALIRGYTSSQFYDSLNEALRSGHGTSAQFTYEAALNAALKKMPTYDGPLWRKTTLPPEDFAKYAVGKAVTWSAFSSCAKKTGVWSGKHTFIITAHSGRDIQKLSQHNSEAEVLFPSGTKFIITKIEGTTIHVTEIEKFD